MTSMLAFVAGLGVATLGTLVGAGGGFLLVPLLAFALPGASTPAITAISLAAVTVNAWTGTFAYLRLRRIDVRSSWIFAATAIPGALAGASVTAFIPRRTFEIGFGIVLIALAAWLAFGKRGSGGRHGSARRAFHDATGEFHRWSFSMPLAVTLSAAIGFFSSLLGIGGGVIQVPVLVGLLAYPEHIAAGTSLAVLAVSASAGTLIHVLRADFGAQAALLLPLCAGAALGALLGARLSTIVPARAIRGLLASALVLVGFRMVA